MSVAAKREMLTTMHDRIRLLEESIGTKKGEIKYYDGLNDATFDEYGEDQTIWDDATLVDFNRQGDEVESIRRLIAD